jgi:hypothetical protein
LQPAKQDEELLNSANAVLMGYNGIYLGKELLSILESSSKKSRESEQI